MIVDDHGHSIIFIDCYTTIMISPVHSSLLLLVLPHHLYALVVNLRVWWMLMIDIIVSPPPTPVATSSSNNINMLLPVVRPAAIKLSRGARGFLSRLFYWSLVNLLFRSQFLVRRQQLVSVLLCVIINGVVLIVDHGASFLDVIATRFLLLTNQRRQFRGLLRDCHAGFERASSHQNVEGTWWKQPWGRQRGDDEDDEDNNSSGGWRLLLLLLPTTTHVRALFCAWLDDDSPGTQLVLTTCRNFLCVLFLVLVAVLTGLLWVLAVVMMVLRYYYVHCACCFNAVVVVVDAMAVQVPW